MPFMLGGIVGAASFVLWYERNGAQLPKQSRWLRLVFMSIIGAIIGNYAIMRGLGGYKKKDAYFAALPGGIIDSAALAEEAGADLRIVTAQHFIRIILVVTSVPLLFLFIQGDAVGSFGGESLASSDYDSMDVLTLVSIALVGLFFGQLTKLPASHMLGPLLLALILSISGVVTINIPPWLVHVAQYVIGTALGAQFSGISRRLLVRGLGMGLLAGGYMLALAAFFASLLVQYVPADFGAMFISFAAGGLAEMSLIALSLNFNPVVVALHHLVRILLTVFFAKSLSHRLFKPTPTRQ